MQFQRKRCFGGRFLRSLIEKAQTPLPRTLVPHGVQTAKKMQKGRNTPFPHFSTVDFTMKKGVCQLFYANFFDDFADFSMISARFCDIMILRIYFRVAFPPFRLSCLSLYPKLLYRFPKRHKNLGMKGNVEKNFSQFLSQRVDKSGKNGYYYRGEKSNSRRWSYE